MSTTAIEIAETFFNHWSANRIDEAIAMLAEDVLYGNVPFPISPAARTFENSTAISASATSLLSIGRWCKSRRRETSC